MAIITKRRKYYSLVYEKDGKQIYETYPDPKIARIRKKQVEHDQYELEIKDDQAFDEYLYCFLNINGKIIWSPKTLNDHISLIDTYVTPYIKQITITNISQGFAVNLFHQLSQVPPSLQDKIRVVLTKTTEELVSNGYIECNPFQSIKIKLSKKNKKKVQWKMEDTVKLLNECKDARLLTLLHLLYGTNLKINEVLALQLDDLFMSDETYLNDECYIRVNKVLERLNKSTVEMMPKDKIIQEYTNRGTTDSPTRLTLYYIDSRFCPINKEMATILRAYIKDKKRLKHKYLISKSDGEAMDRRVLTTNLRDALKELELPHITMKELKAFSNQNYDKKLTNRDYYYQNYCDAEEIVQKTIPLIPNKAAIQNELKSELPDTNQKLANHFISILNEDEDLKIELIKRLKELL